MVPMPCQTSCVLVTSSLRFAGKATAPGLSCWPPLPSPWRPFSIEAHTPHCPYSSHRSTSPSEPWMINLASTYDTLWLVAQSQRLGRPPQPHATRIRAPGVQRRSTRPEGGDGGGRESGQWPHVRHAVGVSRGAGVRGHGAGSELRRHRRLATEESGNPRGGSFHCALPGRWTGSTAR